MTVLLFIVALIFAAAAAGCAVLYTLAWNKRAVDRKQVIDPKVHFPQAGLCQCGDAFCYHLDGKNCTVRNCPCTVFVSSCLEGEKLDAMSASLVELVTMQAKSQNLALEVDIERRRKMLNS